MKEEAVKGPMDLAKGGKSSNKGDNSSKGTEAEDFDAEDEEGIGFHLKFKFFFELCMPV